MMVHDAAFGVDREVRGDETPGAREAAVATGHGPDHRAEHLTRCGARPDAPAALGDEGYRAGAAVSNGAVLDEGAVLESLHARVEHRVIAGQLLHAAVNARRVHRRSKDLARRRGARVPERGRARDGLRATPELEGEHQLSHARLVAPHRSDTGPGINTLEDDEPPRELARGERSERLVGLLEGVAAGDQLVDSKPAGLIEADESRQVLARPGAAIARSADDALAGDDGPRVQGHRVPGCRH